MTISPQPIQTTGGPVCWSLFQHDIHPYRQYPPWARMVFLPRLIISDASFWILKCENLCKFQIQLWNIFNKKISSLYPGLKYAQCVTNRSSLQAMVMLQLHFAANDRMLLWYDECHAWTLSCSQVYHFKIRDNLIQDSIFLSSTV